jgi:hypothetical protein
MKDHLKFEIREDRHLMQLLDGDLVRCSASVSVERHPCVAEKARPVQDVFDATVYLERVFQILR